MNSRHSLFGFVALALPLSAIACIQGKHLPSVRPPVNVAIETTPSDPRSSEQEAREVYARIIRDFEMRPASVAAATIDDTVTYTGALIFMGRTSDAITTLVALEKTQPGHYAVASNLGTAYELSGDLPNALRWIRTGIERDATSHDGTEWLHVAILETKLKLQTDAAWLATHSVLDAAPVTSKAEALRAIEYQLNERLRFVSPRDPVVADLFYQAALLADGPITSIRRAMFLKESLRFDNLRAAEISKLRASS